MKVVVIGAGNVASHLAKALLKADIEITQIWSNTYQNAVSLAKLVNAKPIKQLNEIDKNVDFYIISVKDDAIPDIAKKLVNLKGTIVHTSGAVNLNVFGGLSTDYGVFYPLQTFSKSKAVSFKNIPICVEANNQNTLGNLKLLANKLSDNVREVDSEKRKILHLAAVFACNFTNHLYALAEEILATNQLDFELLRPLIAETANKVQQALPLQVQTGPAIRNDEDTLKKHEELLLKQPHLLNIYKTLSDSIKKTR